MIKVAAPQGAAPGRPDPGAASCTGRILGANNGGAGTRSNGTDKNTTTRVNPQLEAVRTYGPGRVLGIDEAQWGGAKPDPQAGPSRLDLMVYGDFTNEAFRSLLLVDSRI